MLFYTNARMPEFSYQEGDDPYTEDRTTSFTVNYDEQNANKTEIWHALRVSFPLEGEVAELYDATTGESTAIVENGTSICTKTSMRCSSANTPT